MCDSRLVLSIVFDEFDDAALHRRQCLLYWLSFYSAIMQISSTVLVVPLKQNISMHSCESELQLKGPVIDACGMHDRVGDRNRWEFGAVACDCDFVSSWIQRVCPFASQQSSWITTHINPYFFLRP